MFLFIITGLAVVAIYTIGLYYGMDTEKSWPEVLGLMCIYAALLGIFYAVMAAFSLGPIGWIRIPLYAAAYGLGTRMGQGHERNGMNALRSGLSCGAGLYIVIALVIWLAG